MQIHDAPNGKRHTGIVKVEIGGIVYPGRFEIKGNTIEVRSIDLGKKSAEMPDIDQPELIAKVLLIELVMLAQPHLDDKVSVNLPALAELLGMTEEQREQLVLLDKLCAVDTKSMPHSKAVHVSLNELDNALAELELIFRNAPLGILTVAPEAYGRRVIRRANRVLEQTLGYEYGELEGQDTRILYPDDEAYDEISTAYTRVICAGKVHQSEPFFQHKAGHKIAVVLSGSALDPDHPYKGAIWFVEDNTEHKRSLEQINQLAFYDSLTCLPNRRLMLEHLFRGLTQADRFARHLAIMFMDLDHFKDINDTLGHDVGDELLKVTAERLNTCVRSGDTVSRQGGDEFVIVLTEITHPADVTLVAEKIISTIREPVIIQEHKLHVTASIGIAIYPIESSKNPMELLKKADMAMYEVKKAGRNGFRIFH